MKNNKWAGLLAYVTGITRHLTGSWIEQMARTQPMKRLAIYTNFDTCCTIGMRSSVLRSGQWSQPET